MLVKEETKFLQYADDMTAALFETNSAKTLLQTYRPL